MSYVSTFRAKRAKQAEAQDLLNVIYGGLSADPALASHATKEYLLGYLRDKYAEYSQYNGHWDDCELVHVSRDISGKGGQYFKAGDVTLGKEEYSKILGETRWMLYSVRVGVDMSAGLTIFADEIFRL